ncbi:hypothetical protein FCJ59_33425 [Cupriavidus basilensis]|nr:hypothetical protein [Cupriavidus basilensis]
MVAAARVLLAGSITLSGGHGAGVACAMELVIACATFGLVLGGLPGSHIAHRIADACP